MCIYKKKQVKILNFDLSKWLDLGFFVHEVASWKIRGGDELLDIALATWSKRSLIFLLINFSKGESFIPEKDRKKDDEYELKRMENGEGHGEGSSPPAMMDDDDDDDEIYEPPVRSLASYRK